MPRRRTAKKESLSLKSDPREAPDSDWYGQDKAV